MKKSYKEVVNQFNYYYNLWENDKLTFENPDAEEKFLNAVCISRIFAYGEISEDVGMRGDAILERELKKLKDFKIKEKSNNEKSIFKMAEEDSDFKALLNVEWPDSFDFYEELRKLNNPEEKLNSKEIK